MSVEGSKPHPQQGTTNKKRKFVKGEKGNKSGGKDARVIIRNLPWKACEEDVLRKHFGKVGGVVDVNIPVKDDGKKRGFAFVQFGKLEEAALAIQKLNGQKLMGRPVAIDWSLSQEKFKKFEVKVEPPKPEEREKVIQKALQRGNKRQRKGDGDDDDFINLNSAEIGNNDDYEDDDEDEDDEDDEMEDEDGDEENNKRQPRPGKRKRDDSGAPRQPRVDDKKTQLFIRNMSFNSTEDDLEDLFGKYGKVKSALVVEDRITGRPRGTGFVHFYTRADADKALHAAYEGLSSDVSALVADELPAGHAISRMEGNLVLDGRRLIISRAIDRDVASKLSTTETAKKDKRNLHLVQLSAIPEGSELEELFTTQELDFRRKDVAARMKKLKSNTNLFVSPTRISLRNLPLHITEKELKAYVLDTVIRNTPSMCKIPRHKITKKIVLQAKMLRDPTRIEKDGLGRSKGFGFVEFKDHDDAKTFLVHSNTKKFPLKEAADKSFQEGPVRRMITEFAVENVRAVKKHEQKLKKQNDMRKRKLADAEAEKEKEKEEKEAGPPSKKAKLSNKKAAKVEPVVAKEMEPEVAEVVTPKVKLPRSQRRKLKKQGGNAAPQEKLLPKPVIQKQQQDGQVSGKKKRNAGKPSGSTSFDQEWEKIVAETEKELASSAPSEKSRKKSSKMTEEEEEKHLESLVKEYRNTLFG